MNTQLANAIQFDLIQKCNRWISVENLRNSYNQSVSYEEMMETVKQMPRVRVRFDNTESNNAEVRVASKIRDVFN